MSFRFGQNSYSNETRGLADCTDTLKNITSDQHAVHIRHAIFAATVAYMEERGVVYDKNIATPVLRGRLEKQRAENLHDYSLAASRIEI